MIIDSHVYAIPDRLRDIKVKLKGEDIILDAIHRHPHAPKVLERSSIKGIKKSMTN